MNWLTAHRIDKIANQTLSGPVVDSIIATVADMFGRGAPVEKNDWGFNGSDYSSPDLRSLTSYGPGSEVPVPLLVHAVQSLHKYDKTQLGGQVAILREQLQLEMSKVQPAQPEDPNAVQPQAPQVPQDPGSRKVQVLGWGSEFERDMLRIHIPEGPSPITARAINKIIRENAASLGYHEEESVIRLPSGMQSTRYDFPLHKLRKQDKEAFNTWFIHKDFIPHLAEYLSELNEEEERKAPRKRPPREPILWDLSELQGFVSGGEGVPEQPLPQVQVRKDSSNYGNEYYLKFDFIGREFVQSFKSFVHDNLDWWWPKWTGREQAEWHLRGTKDENFSHLADFFADNGFDATPLRQIAEELASIPKEDKPEVVEESQALIPLMVQNATQHGQFHMGLSIPRLGKENRTTYYQAVKLSFPAWNKQRYLDTSNFVYYVKGSYSDYADFGNIMKNNGFDVSQLRQVFSELMQAGVIQKERLNGELDGFQNTQDFQAAASETMMPGFSLYDAQKDGVEFLYGRESAFLGDETGAGKTIQGIIAAKMRMQQSGGKCLIITLHAVKEQWKREVAKFTGDEDISNDPADAGRWTIITYPMLSAPKNGPVLVNAIKSQNYSCMILDEVHNTKNKSKRTQRIHEIGENIPFKWGMSATVSANYPIDVWRQLKSIGHRLGDLSESGFRSGILDQKYIKNRFGGDWVNKGNTPEEQEENGLRAAAFLNKWLTQDAGIYIRRTKKDINPNVSNHTVSEAPIELKPGQRKKLNQAIADRMSQYADPDLAISEMIAQRAEIATAKVPHSLELASNVVDQDKKFLIFTCFRDAADKLLEGAQKLVGQDKRVVSILGGDKDRQAKLDAFKNDPNTMGLVLSILAGGTGIDLPNIVDDVIMNDYSWTPKDAEQAEGRAYRVTSENDINTRYVLAMGTADEDFFGLVQKKRKLAALIDHATSGEERVKAQREMQKVNQEMRDVVKKLQEGRQASNWLKRLQKPS